MFVKVQLLKGVIICVALYLVACVLFIEVRKKSLKKVTDVIRTKYQPMTFHSSSANKINKKDVKLEIEMLRIDELKGESIDMEVYLSSARNVYL